MTKEELKTITESAFNDLLTQKILFGRVDKK